MAYIIGVDGGGTKTRFCLLNTNNNERDEIRTGETNFKNTGILETKENISLGLSSLLEKRNLETKDIAYFVFGMAGCDTESDFTTFKAILKEIEIKKNFAVFNDAKIAFRACSNRNGMIFISGTGSICFSYKDDEEKRIGGWGARFSDFGSGYWIGKKFLTDFLLYLEELQESDLVFEKFKNEFIKDQNPFEYVEENFLDVKSTASIAKFILSVDSEYVNSLADVVSDTFSKLAAHLNKDFAGEEIDLVLSGGVMKNEKIYTRIKNKIKNNDALKNITVILNDKESVEGSLNLALSFLK